MGMRLLGLGALLGGASDVAISTVSFREDSVSVGSAFVVLGVVMASTGYGLLKLKRWAWWMAMALCAVSYLGPVVFWLVTNEVDDMAGSRVIALAIFAVVPLYLMRARTRVLFGISAAKTSS